MDVRGQISAEYLLVIVVVLIILSYSITNFIGPTIDASNDVSWTSDSKNAVSTIANAVNLVYANGPKSQRTVTFHIPKNGMQFTSNSNYLILNTLLNNATTKPVNASINYPVTINSPTLNTAWYKANVTWSPGSSSISINVTAV